MTQPTASPAVASIEYEELEIEVASCVCGEREVRVLSSRFDRPRERFQPLANPLGFSQRLEELDQLMLQAGTSQLAAQRSKLAESIGCELYQVLFPGRIHRTLDRSLARLHTVRERKPNAGLRIRLGFGDLGDAAADVMGLPWELLCDPNTRVFLGSGPESPFVRYLDLDRPATAVMVKPPLRILAVIASPRGLPAIDLPLHAKLLTDACPRGGPLELTFLEPPTLEAMRQMLDQGRQTGRPFHAIHFLGHGAFDDGRGFLHFEDGHGGSARTPGQTLAQMIRGFSELRLAVLATCVGARMARYKGQHPFTGSASALVASGLSAVVAMQFPVSVAAAGSFTSLFYRRLAEGRTLEEAVTEGRLSILARGVQTAEWASPVLFLRAWSGRVFALERAGQRSPRRREAASPSPGSVITAGDHARIAIVDRGGKVIQR